MNEQNPKETNPMRNVFSIRDFRLLFTGVSTSLLGDQFTLIATSWLVLQLTDDPLALGIVLALEGIPRALFMLFGGALTDRFSPRFIMLASDIVRLLLAGLMAFAVFSGIVELWMLYAFSLAFGLLMSGFAGGNLGGVLLAGVLPKPTGQTMRLFLVSLLAAFGIATSLMGFINQTWVDFGFMLLLGLGVGYMTIILFTWIQTRTPKTMLGRIMSLLMLDSAGSIPISQAIAGAVSTWNLTLLFMAAGGLIVLVTGWIAGQPSLVTFSESLAASN